MTVATFTQSDYPTQTGTSYPSNIDSDISVLAQIGQQFAPHAVASPNMTVLVDAGRIIKADGTLVTQAQQTTAAFTAPVGNPRIDRIVVDQLTGAISVIAGTPAASPTAPAITAGKLPCAQVLLQTTSTVITNAMITDERVSIINNGSVSTKAANYTVISIDNGTTLVATSGTWMLSLTTSATLGNGFNFYFFNSGSGTITIAPFGSENINGAATIGVGPGGRGKIVCTGSTWYAIGDFRRGSLVYSSSNQTVTDITNAVVTFDTEAYDTDSIHNTVTNTGRMTVPPGVNAVKLNGQIKWNTVPSSTWLLFISKNGLATYSGTPANAMSGTVTNYHGVQTPVLYVSAGDYFELVVQQNSGASRVIEAGAYNTWFCMETIG